MVGAGFIAFTILNSILALGAKLTIVELAPRILPRMIDDTGAELVEAWLKQTRRDRPHRRQADADRGRQGPQAAASSPRAPTSSADVVIMATGIRTNLDWLKGSGVDDQPGDRGRRPPALERARTSTPPATWPRAADLISGAAAVHAIEPTAQEHGRVVGANMAGKDVRYRGSLIINIVEVCHLDVASFGAWDDAKAEAVSGAQGRPPRLPQAALARATG